MKCRSCSAEISDKAIVCYRCGTPTAFEVAPKPAGRAKPPSRARLIALLVVLAAFVALLVYTYMKMP